MNDNLPKKYNDNIFSKFFSFLRNLFSGKKNETEEIKQVNQITEEKTVETIENDNKANDFTDRIKIDENYKNPEEEKRKIIEELKEKPESLEKLSVNRLEKVLKFYQEENEKKRKNLQKLIA